MLRVLRVRHILVPGLSAAVLLLLTCEGNVAPLVWHHGIVVNRLPAGQPGMLGACAADPEGDSVSLRFAWGDGDTSDWSAPTRVFDTVYYAHTWATPGNLIVGTQARDEHGAESDWVVDSVRVLDFSRVKWSCELGLNAQAPAFRPDGRFYVTANDGLYLFSPDSTRERLREFNERADWPIVAPDGTILVNRGMLCAIDSGGEYRWTHERGTSPPAVAPNGMVYLPVQNTLLALNPDGTEHWRRDVGYPITTSPVVAWDRVHVVTSTAGRHRLVAVDTAGTLQWEYCLATDARDPAFSSDGLVLVPVDGSLEAIDLLHGQGRWHWDSDQPVQSPAVGPDGAIYVPLANSALQALSWTGAERWSFFPAEGAPSGPPAIGPDGTVYVIVDGNCLLAVQGDSPLADAAWPKFRCDLANTGSR